MTNEVRKRTNPDYSASVVNLRNPQEVYALLVELYAAQANVSSLDATLRAMPEYEDMKRFEKKVADLIAELKGTAERPGMIDALGSYQDVENGHYALKQRKVSKWYDAKRFKANYPQYPSAILETMNLPVLEGLIKGGLLTEQDLDTHQVIKREETFAYIIK